MLKVLKASAGIGVAKAKLEQGQPRVGSIECPAYPAQGEGHVWRIAAPVGGHGGRAAYRELREFLAGIQWQPTGPGEGITWLELFAWFDGCRKAAMESLSASGIVAYAEATVQAELDAFRNH
eukprot:15479136-Alexandrium_andersonii.AAC.1